MVEPTREDLLAAIQAAGLEDNFEAGDILFWQDRPFARNPTARTARSLHAHAVTLAKVRDALEAPMLDHSGEGRGVYDILRSILKDTSHEA